MPTAEIQPDILLHPVRRQGETTPRRLPEVTRHMAARYLSGEVGRTMIEADMPVPEEWADLPKDALQARAVRLLAESAPLGIRPMERLAGAAPYLAATRHRFPLPDAPGTSHTTIDFEKALRVGYAGLRAEIDARLARGNLDVPGQVFLHACHDCIDAASAWTKRQLAELVALARTSSGEEKARYETAADNLRRVPEHPPETFRQAVQALWSFWEFQRLCGNWSGLGRVDKMLGPFLESDMAAGRIDFAEARDWIAHFWIKGCEWVGAENSFGRGGNGDAQFYQNVILAGVDESGREIANPVTALILDVAEELHISDYPIAVRLRTDSPPWLLRRVAEVQRLGGGIVSFYNEALVIRALVRFGFPLEEARNFTNDGCWETLVPGKTCFGYRPFDTLALLQETLGLNDDASAPADFPTFEALYEDLRQRMAKQLADIEQAENAPDYREAPASPLLSLWVDGCIEKGRGYHEGGPIYRVAAPHAGGLPDTANSLEAIRTVVYEEQRRTLPELVEILRNNWEGHEDLRREISERTRCYGNGDETGDAMMRRLYDDYTALAAAHAGKNGVLHPPGISTFGREVGWRHHRRATAFGRRAGDILASNLAPTPSTDRQGPTAVIRSFCSLDFESLPNGVPLDLKLHPSATAGDAGLAALMALHQTFLQLGGWYLQLDVIDADTLRDAQRHPERYRNLAVRISGWSARFVTLNDEWQRMVIQRTEQRL